MEHLQKPSRSLGVIFQIILIALFALGGCKQSSPDGATDAANGLGTSPQPGSGTDVVSPSSDHSGGSTSGANSAFGSIENATEQVFTQEKVDQEVETVAASVEQSAPRYKVSMEELSELEAEGLISSQEKQELQSLLSSQ